MDPVFGGLLAGGLVGGLDLFGGLLNNSAIASEGSRNRQFIAKMYKKRYRFTVEDMRKAGLNPVLAASGGNVGQVSSTPTTNFENPFHGAISSAVSAANAVQDIQNKAADRSLTESQTGLNQAKKVSQDIENRYLDPKARALAEKAQAESSFANSSAVIQKARSQYAESMAMAEDDAKTYDMLNRREDLHLKGLKGRILERSPEYSMSASERRWLERVKATLGAVNSAAGSMLSGAKALRYFR